MNNVYKGGVWYKAKRPRKEEMMNKIEREVTIEAYERERDYLIKQRNYIEIGSYGREMLEKKIEFCVNKLNELKG